MLVLRSPGAMADVQPLRALRYEPSVVGALDDVVAPPYDVIDAQERAALAARSPYNVVAVDLPQAQGEGGSDAYAHAAGLLDAWRREGALIREHEPAIWAHTQELTGPDGVKRTRSGFFCRVRVEEYGPGRIRPHERTHPGPKEDRLALTRATATNLSPIFSLYSDPDRAAWKALAPFAQGPPWGEVRDGDATVHRIWRVTDAQAIAAVQAATAGAELLIADGHHRYETALAYAREIDREDAATSPAEADLDADAHAHRYVLMCLVALEDPGLAIFPFHRLVGGLDEHRLEALWETIERDFELAEVTPERLAPASANGAAPRFEVGLVTRAGLRGRGSGALRLSIRDQAIADAALDGRSEAYRHLDTGILEALVLKGALQLSAEDILHLNGLGYARNIPEAVSLVQSHAYDAAFIMRPTPVEQVRQIAAAGEHMPPKSTYFFPKLLTGLLFNPLRC
jgi:uncharacterized protein (DUF1015 family)